MKGGGQLSLLDCRDGYKLYGNDQRVFFAFPESQDLTTMIRKSLLYVNQLLADVKVKRILVLDNDFILFDKQPNANKTNKKYDKSARLEETGCRLLAVKPLEKSD
ncbi:MAG: hypothetical protein OEY79_03100 [Anaplasmataceae bacterium]|nr:hypothetical protein [Anaplasmataceae bacterium]